MVTGRAGLGVVKPWLRSWIESLGETIKANKGAATKESLSNF